MNYKTMSYLTSCDDDDCFITVRYVGAVFYLLWSPTDLACSPDLLRSYLAQLENLKDEDVHHDSSGLVLPFTPLMDQLAPAPKEAPFTLHDYLYAQWFHLKATVAEDNRTILPVQVQGDCPVCLPGIATWGSRFEKSQLENWAPRYFSSRDIELPADAKQHPLLQRPSRVVDSQSQTECFFKGLGPPHKGTFDEIAAFRAIDEATKRGALAADARICRLHGLVMDTLGPRRADQRIVGILLAYIEPKRHGILGTLQNLAYDERNRKHLRAWADDLSNTVNGLHRAGCVWGDAKPENVLVDKDDKVWIIDFGGGHTPGWVAEEDEGTERGDLKAMEKIRKWLEEREAPGGTVEMRTPEPTKSRS